jgi:hypothetical protein
VVSKKHEFTPILLTNGQIQSGSIEPNEKKYYYFKTNSEAPLYASLMARNGNPNLSIYVIRNLSASMYEWQDEIDSRDLPDFESRERFEADVIWLDAKSTKFQQTCGSSCILVLLVDGLESSITSHY